MSICWDMDRRHYIAGQWNELSQKYVITGRPLWRDILGKDGVDFVSDMLRRMSDYEAAHGMKPLLLTPTEAQKWHQANDKCQEEGWDRFYFDKHGELKCASRIRIDRYRDFPEER